MNNGYLKHFGSAIKELVERSREKFRYASEIAIYSGKTDFNNKSDCAFTFISDLNFFYFIPVNIDGIVLIISESNLPKVVFNRKSSLWTPYDYSAIDDLERAGLIEVVDNMEPESYVKKTSSDGRLTISPNDFVERVGLEVKNFDLGLFVTLMVMRAKKTDYELDCIKKSTRVSLSAIEKARERFFSKTEVSEADLFYTFCSESGVHPLTGFAYYPIIALNRNPSILHYHDQSPEVVCARSLLIDAGIMHRGYSADITRTYSKDKEFNQLIKEVENVKNELAKMVRPGMNVHDMEAAKNTLLAHVLLREKLVFGLDEETIVKKVLKYFNNHLVGHVLGLGVHDLHVYNRSSIASFHDNSVKANFHYSFGSVFTIEPGVYFNKTLAERLRESDLSSHICWEKFDKFVEFGGVRVEDNYFIDQKGECVNLTV